MIILEKDELEKLGVSSAELLKAQKRSDPLPSIKKEVNDNSKATFELADAIKKLASTPVSPNTAQDLTPIVEAIHNLQDSQLTVLQLLEKKIDKQKPKNFEFNVVRNRQGSIQKILAKETSK